MAGKLIQIRVVMTKETDNTQEPWNMTIEDSEEIKSYMTRGKNLLFNYKGDIYKAFDISEKEFLSMCNHLKK